MKRKPIAVDLLSSSALGLRLDREIALLEQMRGEFQIKFPSYITHIRFPRYKNMVAGARIDFTFPVTALVGANGSGKTSVLNALYGAPIRKSTGEYWFSTEVDPIEEGDGSPNRFIYGHYSPAIKEVVETRKARVRKVRNSREDPNYWEPTKESPGDEMAVPAAGVTDKIAGRSLDRWNPVKREVVYINFRKELSAFDKYFYFGRHPHEPSTKEERSRRRILTKMDQVRQDAVLLARVIAANDTSKTYYGRKIATENRLLNSDELKTVSFILGREYSEARWIKHSLFKGEEGLSVVFRTAYGRYSEAFAGSGEIAVTSCVVQVLKAERGSLLLLDEPEVSLHPGAQRRLLAFLAQSAKRKSMQIVFSTHSPHLVSDLPDDAIKSFYQLPSGEFSVTQETHPYTAFRRLGVVAADEVLVLVEDRLAKFVVLQALSTIEDADTRAIFRVEESSGGATAILNEWIPSHMADRQRVVVLLDGDQKKSQEIADPSEIPESKDSKLGDTIYEQIGAKPRFLIDGNVNGGNVQQKIEAQRKYLKWARANLGYLPTSCPEELVLKASGNLDAALVGNAAKCKKKLHQLASDANGSSSSSEDVDMYGKFLLSQHRANSTELKEVAKFLTKFLSSIPRT